MYVSEGKNNINNEKEEGINSLPTIARCVYNSFVQHLSLHVRRLDPMG